MKLVTSQTELHNALRLVARAVGNGRTHAITAGVLLHAADGILTVTGYDMELGITTAISASVEAHGATVVPHRLLSDIIGRLDASEAVSLAISGNRLALVSLSGSYSLSVASADDFPALPVVDAANGIAIDLVGPLAAVMPAASTDASKQLLQGIHLATGRVEATDGHRLAICAIDSDAELDLVLPVRCLQQVRQPATIAIDKGQVAIALADGTQITSRTLDGTYPNVRQLVPIEFAYALTVDRLQLLHALERVALIAVNHNSIVKLSTATKILEITAEADANSGAESLVTTGILPDLAINVHYLIDGLKTMSVKSVTLSANTATAPVTLTPDGISGHTYLIMPVQVKS
jgi:DNA polymerase-3 subunit beta